MNSEAEIVARFVGLAGTPAVVTASDVLTAFTVDGCAPCCVLFPSTAEDLSRCVAAADAAGLALIPAGNGTQLHIGHAPQRYDVALSTRRLRRIVAHEAADMTVSVEAGLTLAELNAALAAAGQRLPLDPPYPEHTTIGALIATDACGPLRLSQGKVRDLLIGVTVVLADGSVVKGGGRVVKNVAGYDLMKLFTGSFGTLGIVTEATFKIRRAGGFGSHSGGGDRRLQRHRRGSRRAACRAADTLRIIRAAYRYRRRCAAGHGDP